MSSPIQQYYLRWGHREVRGWLSETAIALIVDLARIQAERGICGSVCEIGVHHGRLFILLHHLTSDDERSVAWDLFERQEENVDRSGHGDRDILIKNLQTFGCTRDRIDVITANSLDLTPSSVLTSTRTPPRLFSVDGGHTAALANHDLELAAQVLHDEGLVIVDDFFNQSWPGVAEGICRYFLGQPRVPLYPVAIGGNKFIFTKSEAAALEYQRALALPDQSFRVRHSEVFGCPVLTVAERRSRRSSPKAWLARFLKQRVIRPVALLGSNRQAKKAQ